MTLRDQLIIQALAGYFVIALLVGIPFGIWQGSWVALFLTSATVCFVEWT